MPSDKQPLQIHLWAGSHPGKVRSRNEDALAIRAGDHQHPWIDQTPTGTLHAVTEQAILMIADGMGGAPAGDLASQLAVEGACEHFSDCHRIPQIDIQRRHLMDDAIQAAHKKIEAHQKHNPEHKDMGTTMVLAWLIGWEVYLAWTGDSRAYILGPNRASRPVTHDHSYVGEMVRAGDISWEEARTHPMSSILSRAISAEGPPEVELHKETLSEGEWLLLCTDGLHDMLSNEQIHAVLQSYDQPDAAGKALQQAALEAGGHDNITLCIARCDHDI